MSAYPAGLAEHLRPIWTELEGTVDGDIPAPALEALCGQLHLMRTAELKVAEEGAVVTDGKGNAVPHPGIEIARKAGEEVRKWTQKYARPNF